MAHPTPRTDLQAERRNILRQHAAVLGSVLEQEGLARQGRSLLEDAGLSEDQLLGGAPLPSFAAYNGVVDRLLEDYHLAGLGVRVGSIKRSGSLGVLGIGMVTGVDLAHTFRFAPMAVSLVSDWNLQFRLLREGAWAVTRYQMTWASGTPRGWEAMEEAFLTCIGVIDEILPGLDWTACELRLRGPAPPHAALYSKAFPCPVRFMQTENELRVPAAWLDRRPLLGNLAVASFCETLGRELVADQVQALSLPARLRRVLAELDPGHAPTLREMAERLDMSERALRNALAREQVSFRGILQQHKLVLARKWLRETRMPIKEISYRLGFSQPQSFYRAFTRETRRTPDQYRGNS